MSVADISCVEVSDHRLFFYAGGKPIEVWGTLSDAKKLLYEDNFVKCNSSVLVNLQYVQSVKKGEVIVDGKSFFLTRGSKKAFMEALLNYRET